MKKQHQIILLLVISLVTKSIAAQSVKRVLFLGNSYTYVNNLPQLFADVAHSAGDSVIFDSNTIGGYTLQNHCNDANSLAKIMIGSWDMVVLQEQSQMPSFPISQVQSSVFPYAHQLDSLIHLYNPCAETIFYMTWGRKTGDATNCSIWPPVCTYEGMDSLLRMRYLMMADDNNGIVAPVGPVWHYIRNQNPLLELYQIDLSHPSLAGSYAAACAFYASVFRHDPMLITNDCGVNAADATFIRSATKAVAFDSLSNWFVGAYDPVAAFNYSVNGGTVSFNSTSSNGINFSWDLGDGTTGTGDQITHTYSQLGSYEVTLTAENCGLLSSITDTITFSSTGLSDLQQSSIYFYDATSHSLRFNNSLPVNAELLIYDLSGKQLIQQSLFKETTSVSLNNLNSGIYLFRVNTATTTFSGKLLIP